MIHGRGVLLDGDTDGGNVDHLLGDVAVALAGGEMFSAELVLRGADEDPGLEPFPPGLLVGIIRVELREGLSQAHVAQHGHGVVAVVRHGLGEDGTVRGLDGVQQPGHHFLRGRGVGSSTSTG